MRSLGAWALLVTARQLGCGALGLSRHGGPAVRRLAAVSKKTAASPTKAASRKRCAVARAAAPVETEDLLLHHAPATPIELDKELEESFMKYAMSTILGRALPDARDGLKPVHRRILFAMRELGLSPQSQYRKCARVVGEVLGKFHPHGDSSVYDALVRMAQDFVMSEMLVDGHGNFGSVDSDPPAAMRYTESRITKFAYAALLSSEDLGKPSQLAIDNGEPLGGGISVEFLPNFDGSEYEPHVLPARVPVLLVNGAQGIAVGMATSIPPHNLGEVIDATLVVARALREGRLASDDDLIAALPGPDFPTRGQIMGTSGIARMYATGAGSIVVRARTHFEDKVRSGRRAIVATELPYLVSKAKLLDTVSVLVNAKRLEGIADIRDESGREGLRVVFELKRDANQEVVLNSLLRSTRLQTTFAANLVAVDSVDPDEEGGTHTRAPVRMTLRYALERWVAFRFECIRLRAAHEERRASTRLHIVEGLLIAQRHADVVVELVRGSATPAEAKEALRDPLRFAETLSAEQADAVLALRLARLTTLETDKLTDESVILTSKLKELRDVLASDQTVYDVMIDELKQIKAGHARPRRTEILSDDAVLRDEDVIENARSAVLVSRNSYIKRTPLVEFAAQSRGGRGRSSLPPGQQAIAHLVSCHDHDTLLCITDDGVCYGTRAFQVPLASRTARGSTLPSVLPLSSDQVLSGLLSVETSALSEKREDADALYLVLLTRDGLLKKTPLAAFSELTARGLIAITMMEGDRLGWARLCRASDSIVLASKFGNIVRFQADEDALRSTSRRTRGVKAMRLQPGDSIVGMDVVRFKSSTNDSTGGKKKTGAAAAAAQAADSGSDTTHVLVLTSQGYGKRVAIEEFKPQRRGGGGVIGAKFKGPKSDGGATDELATVCCCSANDEVIIVSQNGVIVRQAVDGISVQSRLATGVLVHNIADDDSIAGVNVVPSELQGVIESSAEASL